MPDVLGARVRHEQPCEDADGRRDEHGEEDAARARPHRVGRAVAAPGGDDGVGDRAEDGDAHRTADRAHEHVRPRHDGPLVPRHRRLGGDEGRGGDQAEPEADDEARACRRPHAGSRGREPERERTDRGDHEAEERRRPEADAHVEPARLLFLWLLRCFNSPGLLTLIYEFNKKFVELPHSDISGS